MSKQQIKYFTSESVCAGHPDKIADAISDLILDELIKQDPNSRAGIEALVTKDNLILAGEISSTAQLDYEKLCRLKIKDLGYDNPAWSFSSDNLTITNLLHQQSVDIAIGVDDGGAGDQGMMFGYAVQQTKNFMPATIAIAHDLTRAIDQARIDRQLTWLRPDGKSQVTLKLLNNQVVEVAKLVLAVAHDEQVSLATINEELKNVVITPVLAKYSLDLPKDQDLVINGTGVWHIPGPTSDAGLTGRKIIVDSYGGYARVGGGAFSGKDPSKVDRSGAYAARYIAKNIVAHDLASDCEVALAYAIGLKKPLMMTINCFNTNRVSQKSIDSFASKLIDTSVIGIIDKFNLKRPIFSTTVAYGHFGKADLPWEQIVNKI